jgi:hypothetical protein
VTVPSGTFQTYQAVGNAEDFHDAVYDISPTDTPFLTLAKRLKAENRTHQWQTDQLSAATKTNAEIEGDDASANTAIPTTNLKNECQLMDRVAFVSDTQEAVKHYGRDSEMAYQMQKRVKELKRDLESSLVQNNGSTAGAAAGAAKMAGLEAWLTTSGQASPQSGNGTSVGTGTAQTTPGVLTDGTPKTAPTDSTVAGSLPETILKTCIADTYTSGGDASVIMCPPRVKQKISTAFSGIATRFRDVPSMKQAQVIGGVDLYISDFGEHRIVPNRFMRTTTLFGIDPQYVGVAYLQPFSQKPLAVNGHAQKRMVKAQATLVVQNPWAHFKVADIDAAL